MLRSDNKKTPQNYFKVKRFWGVVEKYFLII